MLNFEISGEFGCSEEILTIAAMLQIKNVFVTPSNEKKAAVSLYTVTFKVLIGYWDVYKNTLTEFYVQLQANAKLKFSVYEGDHLTLLNVFQSFLKVMWS